MGSWAAEGLARALLMLARAHCTGVVHVLAGEAGCRLVLVDGAVRAVVTERLDCESPCEALSKAFEAPLLDMRFAVGLAELGQSPLAEPVRTADLVLAAMREVTPAARLRSIVNTHARCELQPSGWGRALLAEATLSAAELLVLRLLQRGAAGPQLRAAQGVGQGALHTWAALCSFRALVPAASSAPDYSLLLRKRRELRSQASAAELLDLPEANRANPAAARSALRRLALKVHPDRLGPDAPPAVQRLSTELMGALLRAEADVRRSAQF